MRKRDEKTFAWLVIMTGLLCGLFGATLILVEADSLKFVIVGMFTGAGFSAALLMAVIGDLFGFGKEE